MQPDASALTRLLEELARSLAYASVIFCGIFAVVAVLERYVGADMTRYRTRNFANDVAYGFFYQGGFYNILIWAPIAAALEPHIAFAKLDILSSLPLPAAYVLYWLGMDFVSYWSHRLQHSSPLLWRFHAVHHSQERLTFITSNRFHLFDILYANLVVLIPIAILGIPSGLWMPFYVAQQFLEYFQHSELHWRYGPLHRWIVSPDFHSIHHAYGDRHHRNFGKMLSVWDFLFGTADAGARPRRYGVAGLDLPENLWQHFAAPLRGLRAATRPPDEGRVIA